MTTDHLFIRGFSNGQPILHLSFDSSDAFIAALERSTFVPALADLRGQTHYHSIARDREADYGTGAS